MSHTSIQDLQIKPEIEELRTREQRMEKMYDIATTRMAKLDNSGFHLEMVLVFSQTLENLIKIFLSAQASKRRILKILGANDPFESIDLDFVHDATLGHLINVLRKFIGRTSLTDQLTRFNNNWRIEVIHRIYDGLKDIEPFEKEINDLFNGKDDNLWEMAESLAELVKKTDADIITLSEHRQ